MDPWLNTSPIDQNSLLSLIHWPNPSQTFSLPTVAYWPKHPPPPKLETPCLSNYYQSPLVNQINIKEISIKKIKIKKLKKKKKKDPFQYFAWPWSSRGRLLQWHPRSCPQPSPCRLGLYDMTLKTFIHLIKNDGTHAYSSPSPMAAFHSCHAAIILWWHTSRKLDKIEPEVWEGKRLIKMEKGVGGRNEKQQYYRQKIYQFYYKPITTWLSTIV